MDIHRCRFVPYNASAINAVAFSHPSLLNKKHSKTTPARLAIGRANGDIEIWNPLRGAWLQEMTIPGGRNRSIEGLVWTVDEDEELDGGRAISHGRMRLFSIGYTNAVTEWDLENACALRHASGQHGEIWCLAAQPRSPGATAAEQPHRLVGGTMTGCLVLYSTEDDGLRFQRMYRTPKKSVKMTCIAFQSRQTAVVGCSDSTIRVFDLRNGTILHALSLGRDLPGGVRDVIVWSIRCLPSGDFVSGDSTGQICIWDGRTYTQAQRIQSHTQDVLSLATSADGSVIVSGGMDRRVALYRQMPGEASRWTKIWHRRYHNHDVKAMASFESKEISVVVAGGPDATPVILPLRNSGVENHRALSHLPQTVPVLSAPQARLVVCWWERQAHIWSFDTSLNQLLTQERAGSPETDLDRHRRLAGLIKISGDANISNAAISTDGSLVVITTVTEIKAFQLRRAAKSATATLAISKVSLPPSVASKGATAVAISPDGRWVCLAHGVDGHVTMLQVTGQGEEARAFRTKYVRLNRIKRAIPSYELVSGLGRYDRRMTHIAFSPDSRMVAVADIAGYVDTWVLRGVDGVANEIGDAKAQSSDSDDSDSEVEEEEQEATSEAEGEADGEADHDKWIRNPQGRQLPRLSGAPVVLSFAPDVPGQAPVAGVAVSPPSSSSDSPAEPARDYVLLAITASSQLLVFNPLRARLAPWFRHLGRSSLPLEYRNIRDLAKGAMWQGPRMWIYGATFVFMIDTSMEPEARDPATAAAGAAAATAKAAPPIESHALISTEGTQQVQEPPLKKRKRGTGAGNKMALGRMEPEKVRMVVASEANGGDSSHSNGDAGNNWVDVDMEEAQDDSDDDDSSSGDEDDDDETRGSGAITSGKPQKPQKPQRSQDKQLVAPPPPQQQHQQQQLVEEPQKKTTRWWHTFKFRPILGAVPLAAYDAQGVQGAQEGAGAYPPLEVALVERPGWDIDLPVRYDAD